MLNKFNKIFRRKREKHKHKYLYKKNMEEKNLKNKNFRVCNIFFHKCISTYYSIYHSRMPLFGNCSIFSLLVIFYRLYERFPLFTQMRIYSCYVVKAYKIPVNRKNILLLPSIQTEQPKKLFPNPLCIQYREEKTPIVQ